MDSHKFWLKNGDLKLTVRGENYKEKNRNLTMLRVLFWRYKWEEVVVNILAYIFYKQGNSSSSLFCLEIFPFFLIFSLISLAFLLVCFLFRLTASISCLHSFLLPGHFWQKGHNEETHRQKPVGEVPESAMHLNKPLLFFQHESGAYQISQKTVCEVERHIEKRPGDGLCDLVSQFCRFD